jgi:hypothetical protein
MQGPAYASTWSDPARTSAQRSAAGWGAMTGMDKDQDEDASAGGNLYRAGAVTSWPYTAKARTDVECLALDLQQVRTRNSR